MSMVIVGTDRGREYFALPGGEGWTTEIAEAATVAGPDDPLYVTLRAAPPLHLERIELKDRADFDDALFASAARAWVLMDDKGDGPFVVGIAVSREAAEAWSAAGDGTSTKYVPLYESRAADRRREELREQTRDGMREIGRLISGAQ